MIVISHRGNLNGPEPSTENTIAQIKKVLDLGFNCEVDIWGINGQLSLGHDTPGEIVDISFLNNPKVWVHAKNLEALVVCKELDNNVFFHNTDDYVLTSQNTIWTYPGKNTSPECIIVLNENDLVPENVLGICTDYPLKFQYDKH